MTISYTKRRIAKAQDRTLADLHVCYEASACGFWIARRFLQMGVHCEVIGPLLIPTKSEDKIKTPNEVFKDLKIVTFQT